MSLDRFLGTRLVVQTPHTKLYDAARAMADNRVGAVLVHDGALLAGIVTDRDLALRVADADLDLFESQLADIMSAPVAALSRDASLTDVTALMIAQRVRRVPIVDGANVLGLVTLDDLILEHAVDTFTLAAIVRMQLGEASRLKPAGRVHPASPHKPRPDQQRGDARARQTYAALLKQTMDEAGLASADKAECALQVVLCALLRRVPHNDAGNFLAQLPSRLRAYAVQNVPSGPDPTVTRTVIERTLAACLDLGDDQAARVGHQVARVLAASVSSTEVEHLKHQLPNDLRDLFDAALPRHGAGA